MPTRLGRDMYMILFIFRQGVGLPINLELPKEKLGLLSGKKEKKKFRRRELNPGSESPHFHP